MSVELSGPKGFEVQYLVTLWIGLLAEIAAPGGASVRVEEKEDAEATLVIDRRIVRIAMQSKYEKGDLDISKLARWLAHFGPPNDSECLLGRVLRDERQIALFVTRSRCDDNTRAFLKLPGDRRSHSTPPINLKMTRMLAGELAKVHDAQGSSLQKSRALECVRLGSTLSAREVQAALQRVVVWEQITSERVEEEIANLLNQFRVVASQSVIDALLREVKAARESRGELMPGLRQVLRAHAADRMLQGLHTPRAEDSLLASALEKQGVLWLTGRSQSGKTHLGQTLAQAFQNEGVACLQTDDLKKAREFLSPDALRMRLVLLDDPLLQAADPLRAWEAISKLAASLASQHRLIVTAKLEHLVEIDPRFSSHHTDIFGYTWYDLTAKDRRFLLQYWQHLTQQHAMPPSVVAAIAEYLKSCDSRELLQPGQLRHLAHIPPDQLFGQCRDELVRLARFNARRVAREIAQDQNSRMLSFALGMGATTKSGIHSREIAFLHSANTERPAVVQEDDDHFRSFLPQSNESPSFPTYAATPALSAETAGILRKFEQRGFITFANGRYHFAHPDYREAFQQRLLLEVGSGIEDVLVMLDRAYGALDPAVGVSAARFMGLWLRSPEPGEPGLIPQISEIGFHALRRNIFPNVRAAAILSLVQQLDRLSAERAKDVLLDALSFDSAMRSVVWSGENAWLHRDWLADLQRSRRKLAPEAVASAINRLKDYQTTAEVSGQEADAVNTAYLHHEEPMPDAEVLFALMNREEVFIRADAAQVVMSSACVEGERLRQRVFDDEHPLVLSRAVLATFEHWRSYSSAAKADLRLRNRAALKDPAVAAISSRWLFDLGDQHSDHHDISWPSWNENEKRDLWSLWADVTGASLRTLGPRRFLMNSGRFRNSTRTASQWLTPEEACQFGEAWMEWIEEQTKLRSLDDFATSIAKFLLEATQAQPALREDLTVRALRLIETDALAQSLGAFIDRWHVLTGRERKAVWRLLRSARKDVEWLRAVVLTRVKAPPELISLIASRPDFFHLSPEEQVATLPAPLLAKCLQLLTGPAGWGATFGIPISAIMVWERILNVQLSGLDQPHFVLAVTHLLYKAVDRATDEEPALVEQWTALCAAGEATRSILFRELLNVSLNVLHSRLGPFWKAYFALVTREDERGLYVEEIVKNIEGLSYAHGDLRELVELFGPEFFLNEILKQSMADFVAYNLVLAVPTPNKSAELAPTLLELINALYQKNRPRILPIHDRILNWLEAMNTAESRQMAVNVNECRLAGIQIGSDQAEARRPFEPELRNWIAQSAE